MEEDDEDEGLSGGEDVKVPSYNSEKLSNPYGNKNKRKEKSQQRMI